MIYRHWNESRKLWQVDDDMNFTGYGETIEEAALGYENDRRSEFTPFHEWHGDNLVKI